MRLFSVLLAGLAGAVLAAPALAQTPAAPAAPAGATQSDPMDKMVCRRQVETGSLVRAQRKCHTRRQWAYLDEQNQTAGRTLVDETRGRISGN